MRHWLCLSLLATACVPDPGVSIAPVIFGSDDRIEVYQVEGDALRDAVRHAVPAMVNRSSVRVTGSGEVILLGDALGPSHFFCAGEAHFDQPSAASCSATLIDDDLVLTAGHCVQAIACADQRFVFGWFYASEGVLSPLDSSSVFSCAEVLVQEYTGANDYAIVRLDRAAPGPPMEVRREPVMLDEPVSLAGYPFGIPMKVVETGIITGVLSPSRFYARLDAQPGNSGSGVFDSELRVVGDLTNGPVDALVVDGDCYRLRVIEDTATVTEFISSVIPAIDALCASGHSSERLCAGFDAGPRPDGGPRIDAGRDAGRRLDAGRDATTADAAVFDGAVRDVGPSTRGPGFEGCTCRAGTRNAPPDSVLLAFALTAMGARTLRRRATGAAGRAAAKR